ncbi:hypothetical protein OC844_005394 [Tilletia horrida]|nr:hypothetical protein OC844_005394 [Tilletia horrida]
MSSPSRAAAIHVATTATTTPTTNVTRPALEWNGQDAVNVSVDVLDLFATVGSALPVAGGVFASVLAAVKNIVVSVREVNENREAAEALARRILTSIQRTLGAVSAAGVVLHPEAAITRTMQAYAEELNCVLNQIDEIQHARPLAMWSRRQRIRELLQSAERTSDVAIAQATFDLVVGLHGQRNAATPDPTQHHPFDATQPTTGSLIPRAQRLPASPTSPSDPSSPTPQSAGTAGENINQAETPAALPNEDLFASFNRRARLVEAERFSAVDHFDRVVAYMRR